MLKRECILRWTATFLFDFTEELEGGGGGSRSGARLIVEVTDLKYLAEMPSVVSEITEEIESSLSL